MNRYFKKIGNTKSISSLETKGLSDEIFKPPPINNNSLAPKLDYISKYMRVDFNGNCLIKQNKFTFNKKIVNIYIVYDLQSNLNDFDPTLQNCSFRATKITKKSDMSKYNYSGYGVVFDWKGTFLHPTGTFSNNVIIFGADMSNSAHSNNRANNILVLGEDVIQKINGTTIYAEKIYSVNLSVTLVRLVLGLHYNGIIVICLSTVKK